MVSALVRQGSYGLQDPLRKGGSDEAAKACRKRAVRGCARRVVFFFSDVLPCGWRVSHILGGVILAGELGAYWSKFSCANSREKAHVKFASKKTKPPLSIAEENLLVLANYSITHFLSPTYRKFIDMLYVHRRIVSTYHKYLSHNCGKRCGRFFPSKYHTDFRPGKISGEFSQKKLALLDELSPYTRLPSNEGVLPRLSLNCDFGYTCINFIGQNVTLITFVQSKYHTDDILPGVLPHISFLSRFQFCYPKM